MKKFLLSLLAVAGIGGMMYAGDGTKENPYSVDEMIEKGIPASPVADVYVQAYIVGSVDGQVYASGCNFGLANASNTNILIAGASGETDKDWAMPVQLPSGDVRNALSLQQNPDNLGHQVLLCGSWEKYFGVNGLKSITSYEWIGEAPTPGGGSTGGGNTGSNDSDAWLVNNMDGFTINNVVLPEGLTYVWAWDAQYGAKATAYANQTRYTVDSYLISPEFEVSAETPSATFSQALNYLNGANRADFVNIYVREGEAGEWQLIEPSAWPAGSDWGFIDDCVLDLSAYAGKKIQIGFRYQSTDVVATTWEVKRLKVGATGSTDTPTTPTGVWTVAEALTQMQGGFEGEAQVKGYITAIDEVNTQYGNATYYISDDTAGSNKLEVFRGNGINGAKFTAESELEIGALVTVSGKLINYNGTFEFTTGSSIVSYEGPNGDNPGTTPTPSEPSGEKVTFNFADPASLGFETGDATEIDLTGMTLTSGVVSMAVDSDEGASTKARLFFDSKGAWSFRFYKDTNFTVSVPEDYTLTGIEFNGTNLGTNWTYSNGSLAGNTWTPASATNTVTIAKTASGNNPAINTMTVYYSNGEDDGVDSIIVDDSQAVYYNLQGVKVANPERGIFVKVSNGKATKVLVK